MAELFQRSELNPLLTARDLPYHANAVFNAGVAQLQDEVVLLLRVESASGRSHITLARSKNGVTGWRISERALLHPEDGFPYETFGIEDCRVTRLEDLNAWGLAYTAYSEHGPGVGLALTRDFQSVERIGLVLPPDDKDAVLFPCRFDGLFAMLHRPAIGGGSIWIAYSPDLVFWGKTEVVIPRRGGPWWDGLRVGAGLPPIRTDKGWLVIYHGVKEIIGHPIYRVGAALLDLDEPHRLVARTRRWLLTPREPYEQLGDAPKVIFPCGGFVREGELWMYYGACDSCICLATAPLDELLEVILAEKV